MGLWLEPWGAWGEWGGVPDACAGTAMAALCGFFLNAVELNTLDTQ